MDVEPTSKCVSEELNSRIGIRSQDSYFSESDGAPPTSMTVYAHMSLLLQLNTALPHLIV